MGYSPWIHCNKNDFKTKFVNFKGSGPKNLSFINFKFTLSGREEGGGFRMGNTCIPVADSL